MHTQSIVLRKIAGRLEACWSATRAVAGGGSAHSIASIGFAFAFLLLIPLALFSLIGLIGLIGAKVGVAIAAKSIAGKTLLAGTTAVPGVQEIKDEILQTFEQFKASNDRELAEIKKSGEASAETKAEVERMNQAMSDMQAKINRLTVGAPDAGEQIDANTKKRLQAFFAPSENERQLPAELKIAFGTKDIQAAQAVGTAGAGGAVVAPAFSNRLERAMLFFSGMLQNAETVTTESGAALTWPTVNDTTQQGAILAENATVAAQDVTFSTLTFNAYKYTSKLIAVSWELLQDSAFDIEALVSDIAGERLGRILNNHFTVGTGSSQPNGAVTAASSGKVGTTGQTTSVIYDDLIDLIHSVDIAYRGQSKFMLSDGALKVIRKIKDSQGRPLWEPSLQAGQPDTVLGYGVVVNNDVPAMAANAKSILFGDLSRYKIRRVRDITLVRMNERYADALQTGFFAFARFDGNLVNAGTNPLKYYQNSAT